MAKRYYLLVLGIIVLSSNLAIGKMLAINVQKQSLDSVIADLSQQSGYTINITNDLLALEVSGKYESENIEEILRKLLRGYNTFQVIDSGQKKLSIYTNLNEKKIGKSFTPNTQPSGNKFTAINNLPVTESGKTTKELLAQRGEYLKKVRNGEIDPQVNESGLSSSRLTETREEYKQKISDGDIDPPVNPVLTTSQLLERKEKFAAENNIDKIRVAEESSLTPEKIQNLRKEFVKKIKSGKIVVTHEPYE